MNKRKILLLASTLLMVAVLAVGGTLAYFTDTDQVTNTFTMGKVDISLDEGKVVTEKDENGKDVYESTNKADRTDKEQEYFVFPGDTVVKDPTIHVDGESQVAWIAVKITIKGNAKLPTLFKGVTKTHLNIRAEYADMDGKMQPLVAGGVTDETAAYTTWNGLGGHLSASAFSYQDVSKAANGEWVIYMFFTEAKKAGTDILLFDTVNVPAIWDNAEAAIFNETVIKIDAYAVQANNFDDVYTAMTTAFAKEFDF